MKTTSVAVRRGLAGTFAVTALGGVMVTSFGVPSAGAGQDPCAASQVAKTIGMVATSTGTYLDAHPVANQTLTNISQQQPGPHRRLPHETLHEAHSGLLCFRRLRQDDTVSRGDRDLERVV